MLISSTYTSLRGEFFEHKYSTENNQTFYHLTAS